MADTSELWGKAGEKWTPKSRLPDFSYAGYRGGERPIPDLPVKCSVKDFGAVGDGVADDTTAFLKAIKAVREGTILIPAGRYRITEMLRIRKGGIVLKGEGVDSTVLYFSKSLTQAVGPGKDHAPDGDWSWSGGFISFEGWDEGRLLTAITSPARRGDNSVRVSDMRSLEPGDWVRVVLTDDSGGSLGRHLHADQKEASKSSRGHKIVDFASPIDFIDGSRVILKRPLRTDVRLAWKPALYAQQPSVQDVGIEDLTLEFPKTRYVGHHEEPGYNAVSFVGVSNGWARRLRIINADSGIFLTNGTKFCTVESIQFSATLGRLRKGYGRDPGEPAGVFVGGHHGILAMDMAQDNLITNFQMNFRFIHDIGVSVWAAGNVFSVGRGIDMDFDHHRRGSYENLFTQIQVGEGSRLWESGGDEEAGPPSGARETFWNIQADHPQALCPWGIQGNFVGITTTLPTEQLKDGNWWEAMAPDRLEPPNLYLAQCANRSASPGSTR